MAGNPPKRKVSRSNTRSRRAQWKAEAPALVKTIENGKVLTIKSDTGCYTDHTDPDLPAKNRNDNSYTRYDPAAGTISFRTTIGGRDVPSCARTYSLK